MNRKLSLLTVLLVLSVNMQAQDDEIFSSNSGKKVTTKSSNVSSTNVGSNSYMQEAGSRSFEVSFNPGNIFGSNTGDAISLMNGVIKYRTFSSFEKAARYGINVNFTRATGIIQEADSDADELELKSYTTSYGLTFMPGIEKHYNVSDRISPYTGFQGLLGYNASSYTREYQSGSSVYTETVSNDPSLTNYGSFVIGAGVFTGVDYYFVKHFYLGVELGVGLQYAMLLDSEYTNSEDSNLNSASKNGSIISLAPGLSTGNIRLGWTF